MRILFMGTPDIANESLRALINAGHEICGVFTREDKPVGRKQVVTAPPVKRTAEAYGIPVWQPRTLKDGSYEQIVRHLAPDIVVVVAYGRLIPSSILYLPRYGCINLHVSLLPKYRGSAPVQWAVLNGDKRTGVSIMQLNEGIDTGDILMTSVVDIFPEETSGELFNRVSAQGAVTLLECLHALQIGKIKPKSQNESEASLAPPLTKKMAEFKFDWSASHIHNWVRGMNPWPVAYFVRNGKKIKVLQCRIRSGENSISGTVLSVNPLVVQCREDAVELLKITPEGGKTMEGQAWAFGQRLKKGDIL